MQSSFVNRGMLAPARLIDGLTLVLLFAVVAVLSHALIPALLDDSFIYLRVAEHIANGDGWVYNLGERANPATSTLYCLLLVVIGLVSGFDVHTLAVGYAVSLSALIAIQYLAWRESDGWLIAVTIAIGTCFSARLLGAFGMESPLLLAMVSAAALAWRRHADSWQVGVFAGLAALTRPEGVIVLGLIGLLALWQRRIVWRSLGTALLIVLPWLLFSFFYFGTVTSQTAAVKAAQRHYGWWATQPDFMVGFLSTPNWPWLTLPLAAVGVALALRRMRHGDAFAVLCMGFGLLQVLGYQLLGAPLGYAWYFASGNFSVDLAIMLVGIICIGWIKARVVSPVLARVLAGFAAVILLVLGSQIGMAPAGLPENTVLAGHYRAAAVWLRNHAAAEDTFAATEIGHLGWYSGLRVLDIHGLIHPQALPQLRARNLHWWWDRGERPRFIVAHVPAWHGEPGSVETWPQELNDDFARQYHGVFEDERVSIFMRNEETLIPPGIRQ